jgi:tRNA(Ser,Leu) C12 N-acetylase TAN1
VQRWNVLATSFEGRRDELLRVLRRLGRFGGGGHRNVAIGWVDDRAAFLDALRERLADDAILREVLARVVPVDETFQIDPGDPLAAMEPIARAYAPRLAGGSFFVRVERRGLKGTIHSSDLERALGGVVWQALEAAGHAPRVTFADADRVLCFETLGERAGVAVVERAAYAAYPFVRVR